RWIEAHYQVANGRIRSPGKFEDEMVYVAFYWGAFLDGGADDERGDVLMFDVSDDERVAFPELGTKRRVRLRETDTGFVVEV
ncbi:MAG: hypothetical protein Q8S13_10640, partial [Dehalococcoidia bacterium]|nr:hypothetical protein [Dehalococcoidia bacterium]